MKSLILALLTLVAISTLCLEPSMADWSIDNNMMSLLPSSQYPHGVLEANEFYQAKLSQNLVLAVSGEDWSITKKAVEKLASELAASNNYSAINYRSDNSFVPFQSLYPYRASLLNEEQITILSQGREQQWISSALADLYSPLGMISAATLQTDPLGLFRQFLLSLSGGLSLLPRDGLLATTYQGDAIAFVFLRIKELSPDLNFQQSLVLGLEKTIKNVTESLAVKVRKTGVLFYVNDGSQSAKKEISIVSTGSLLGIILLFFLLFRSPFPLLYSFLILAFGFGVGLFSCLVFFEHVHLFTLVIGSSLLGLGVDYCLHFFCQRFNPRMSSGSSIRNHLLKPLTGSFVTTLGGCVPLLLLPFPLLNQMATFSISGLTAIFITVLLVLPRLSHRNVEAISFLKSINLLAKHWRSMRPTTVFAIVALNVALIATLLPGAEFDDDIRHLQQPSEALKNDEQYIKNALNLTTESSYFLVSAPSINGLLKQEEALIRQLHQRGVTHVRATSQWLPSLEQQEASRSHYAKLAKAYISFYQQLGKSPSQARAWTNSLIGSEAKPLDHEKALKAFHAHPLLNQWLGKIQDDYFSVVSFHLEPDKNFDLRAFSSEQTFLIDPVTDLSALFQLLREQTIKAGWIGLVAIILLVNLLYGKRRSFYILIPPLLSAFMALSLTGLLNPPLNTFNVLAIFLVVGLGLDYAIFYSEDRHHFATHMAVATSFLTTLLSFGLLALSQTHAIASFGVTLSIGMCCCFIFAPFAARNIHEPF